MRNVSLSDQLDDHMRNRDDLNLARQVERETVEAAIQACEETCDAIGALPGSSIHSALTAAAERIRKISN